MDREKPQSSKDRSHRQFRSVLRTFRPADAAFVLHLAQCASCRSVASRLLAPEETAAVGGFIQSLSSLERDFVLDLTRGGFLLGLAEAAASQEDLPPTELRSFLDSLGPEKTGLIRHLLVCQTCQEVAAKTLAPKPPSPEPNPISRLEATA